MSQDTGLFSVRRPRETLGGISYNTGIPPPGSSMKRSHNSSGAGYGSHGRSMSGSRHSLAMSSRPAQPALHRSSSGNNLADLGHSSVKRSSYQQPPSSYTSTVHTPANARASMGADRRSSLYQPRQSTSGAPSHRSFFQSNLQPAGVLRDPRPLKDRSYQARIGQELLEYMSRNDFEAQMGHVLSPNAMKSPTQKDFNCMFQWLYHRIDPSYKFIKNIDHQVPPILKQLKYPFERSITKSQLAAVGGQNWSTFLGLLHWMMQLAQMLDGYMSNQYMDACLDEGVDVSGDLIIFDFLSGAYNDWISDDMSDNDAEKALAPHIEAMARAFERSRSRYMEELKVLEEENPRLLKEMEDLKNSTPDESELSEEYEAIKANAAEYEEYNSQTRRRIEKYEDRNTVKEQELEKLEQELKEMEEKRKRLQSEVDAQGISVQDIDRMIDERERVKKGLESTTTRLDEAKRNVLEKELEASSKLSELEDLIKSYNSQAYRVGIVPATACNAKGRDYELKLMVDDCSDLTSSNLQSSGSGPLASTERLLANAVAGYQPGHLFNLDLRGYVRPNCLELQKEISERCSTAVERRIKDHERLDAIKEAINDKTEEGEALQERIRTAEHEHGSMYEVMKTQRTKAKAQIEEMEKKLSRMRSEVSELEQAVQLMEHNEINTTTEYEQLNMRGPALRQELSAEIERSLDKVTEFKIHIQHDLELYEKLVHDEWKTELGIEGDCDETGGVDI
ncbi:hypothetical protein CDD81_923 [Ophiocordyceps australis]|uniref:Kinetochore protein NDC80 n=1 Tax=Ophiocordyceps australis TaxID=1399860 RepID=A0A2C5Y916_9HYPO|nr:hypothetical protein CDD81_923 [Ophiocordyceps australis]